MVNMGKRKGMDIRGMGRGVERDFSLSSNGSTSRSHLPRVDEQQLQEVQEHYEQRLKELEDCLQQQIEQVEQRTQQKIEQLRQRVIQAESMYNAVQSQFAAIYAHIGMPPPPPQSSPPRQVSPQNIDDRGDNV